MKLSQAKEYLPLIQAAAEGKTIQRKTYCDEDWIDITEEHESWPNCPASDYRIKPTPKLRPWKPEEVPVGAIVREQKFKNSSQSMIVAKTTSGLIFIVSMIDFVGCKLEGVQNHTLLEFEYSTDPIGTPDNNRTWNPCGIYE